MTLSDNPGGIWGYNCNNFLEAACIESCRKINIRLSTSEKGENDEKNTQARMKILKMFLETGSDVPKLANCSSMKKRCLSESHISKTKLTKGPKETSRIGNYQVSVLDRRVDRLHKNYLHKIQLSRSNPSIGKINLTNINKFEQESTENKELKIDKGLLTKQITYLLFLKSSLINSVPLKQKFKSEQHSNTFDCKLHTTSHQETDDYRSLLHRQSSYSDLKSLIGPYAQTQIVYNVMEQTAAQMKEKGTSQQFKQRSQGIGSGSVSSGNDSSSASSKKRTIKIESGISFSVEFIDRGKKSSESEVSRSESEPETKKKKVKEKKKSLHRCLCTTSFPTDDKKLKNKPCDSGVCVPGECSPSECFKRLQQKYGSKSKKSDSDVSSQTSKKKERAGKETLVKEKGSSSISKYKETVEEITLPKKEPEKFNCATCMTNFCKKIQFWKKDKHIDLKPAVMGTDISLKPKSFGSNAASQSVEKGISKKDKKQVEKKGKKISADKKEVSEEKAKAGAKDKKQAEKKGKVKAGAKEEVKTETKATGKEMKKTRPLKPYECEPGVCSPKVCIPKECYERKFPPPPPPKQVNSLTKFKNCLRKMCCKRPPGEEKAAATQSPKTAPEKTPGATVYQEKGTSGPKTGKKKGQKGDSLGVSTVDTVTAATGKTKKRGTQKADTAVQLPVDGGDVPMDKKSKKPTAYSGIQYFQTVDNERMTARQGLNIGSECECSVEFYKLRY